MEFQLGTGDIRDHFRRKKKRKKEKNQYKTCEKIPMQTATIQHSGPLQERKKIKKKTQQTKGTTNKGENQRPCRTT